MAKYLFLILFFVTHLGFSQQKSAVVSGKVFFEDQRPVAWATLHIKELNKHATADELGQFALLNIPYGSYTVEVQSIEAEKTVLSIQVNQPKLLVDVKMSPANARQLTEVVLEGNSAKKRIEQSGYSVHVIETKQAEVQSLQTNDLLNRSVGVRVRQNGGLGSQVSYNINGMSGNSVRLLIDGIPISTYGDSFSINSIPPALIDRVEVYKGVLPAHLSEDALGGAINVVLKKGIPNTGSASISYGSFNTSQWNMNISLRDATSGLTLKSSGFSNYSDNDYEVWGKFVRNILPNGRYDYVRAKRFNNAYRSSGLQMSVGVTGKKWIDELLLGINSSKDYNEIQHGTYMTIPYKGRFTTSGVTSYNVSVKKVNLIDGLDIQFNGVKSHREEIVNDTVKWNYDWFGQRSIGLNGAYILRPQGAQQGAPTLNHIDRQISTYRSSIAYAILSNHKISLHHFQYIIDRNEQDFMKSEIERTFIGTRDLVKEISTISYDVDLWKQQFKGSVFLKNYQQKLERINPILVNNAGSLERSENRASNQRNTNGYGLTSILKVSERMSLIFSAERAVRLPSENEVFGSPGDNITENIGILPERSDNLNIGFRATPIADTRQLEIYASGFIRDTKDKIVQRINPRLNDAVQTNPYENLGSTKSIGFETELNYRFNEQLSLLINLSKFNSVFNQQFDPNGNQYTYFNQQLPNEPFFTANTTINYRLKNPLRSQGNLTMNHTFNFVDRFYTTWLQIEDFRTPRQFIHDIGLNYSVPTHRWVASFDMRNMFNKQVYDNFAVQKPGRAYYIKLTYNL